MKKEIINNEEIEVMETEEIVETEKKQKFGSKIVGWGKKNGKKIVTGVTIAAVGALGYVLGQKTADKGCDDCGCDDDIEYDDSAFEAMTSEEEI